MDKKGHEKINKDWQKKVKQEKKVSVEKNENYHKPTFKIFLSSMAMQAMIAIGKLENPITKKISTNFSQASFLIQTLDMIKDKTENNLSEEEQKLLDESISNLKSLYLEVNK